MDVQIVPLIGHPSLDEQKPGIRAIITRLRRENPNLADPELFDRAKVEWQELMVVQCAGEVPL